MNLNRGFLYYIIYGATFCFFCNPVINNQTKAMKKFRNVLPFMFALLFLTSCHEEIEPADLTQHVLPRDGELFTLLQDALQRGDHPVENTVCIDFVYPFKIFIYDAAFHPQGSVSLYNDAQFSDFLGGLDPDVAISISYPIQTSLPDGTIFSVNSDEQLKLALDSCSREDIILHCNGLIKSQTCVWEMKYQDNQDNEFAESIFKANGDGSISFHHRNTDYLGTWIFLFINDSLFLNINLEGTSDVAQQWNHNYEVTVLNQNLFQIRSGTIERTFTKACSNSVIYHIGDIGPAGGIIAHDKGQYTNGWRYIEVAPSDNIVNEEWGCNQSSVEAAEYDEIGTGYQNTIANVQFHNNLTNYYLNPIICSATNNGSLSAKTALEYSINASDWFIPSINELQTIHDNLLPLNLGNFDNTSYYWSSTEFDTSKAKCLNFIDGQPINILKNNNLVKTRLIRFF